MPVKTEAERIAILETRVEELTTMVREQSAIIREMRDTLMQARGARWIIFTLISTASMAAAVVGYLWPRG